MSGFYSTILHGVTTRKIETSKVDNSCFRVGSGSLAVGNTIPTVDGDAVIHPSPVSCCLSLRARTVYIARFFEVQKLTLFARSVCDFIFSLPYTSVESYARLSSVSRLSYYNESSEPTEAVLASRQKSVIIPGCVQGDII